MFRLATRTKFVPKTVNISKYQLPQFRYLSSDTNNASSSENAKDEADKKESEVTKDNTVTKLQEEVKTLKDQLLRSYAEGENIRRIAQKDVENARLYANTSFAKAMLEIADDLERALAVVPADKRNTSDNVLNQLTTGIELTEKNLQKIFSKFGIAKYGQVDEKFDPNVHDALYQIPDATKEPDTVGQIVMMGYKIKDRVLRPAQVGIRTKPSA